MFEMISFASGLSFLYLFYFIDGADGCVEGCVCEQDRISKCPGELANYTEGSDLYNCLMYNYDTINSDCYSYLTKKLWIITTHVSIMNNTYDLNLY